MQLFSSLKPECMFTFLVIFCFQNSSPVDCLCTWLYTIINERGRSKFKSSLASAASFQWHSWTLHELFRLIYAAIESGAINLVHKGFFIFDKVYKKIFVLVTSDSFLLSAKYFLRSRFMSNILVNFVLCSYAVVWYFCVLDILLFIPCWRQNESMVWWRGVCVCDTCS